MSNYILEAVKRQPSLKAYLEGYARAEAEAFRRDGERISKDRFIFDLANSLEDELHAELEHILGNTNSAWGQFVRAVVWNGITETTDHQHWLEVAELVSQDYLTEEEKAR